MLRDIFILTFLILVTFSDIRSFKIPDILVFSLLLVLACYDVGQNFEYFSCNIFSAIFFFAIFFVLYRYMKGIGFGDVKLISVLAYGVGFFNTVFLVLVSAVFGLGYFFVNRNRSVARIPFAPFLLAGFLSLKLKDLLVYAFR